MSQSQTVTMGASEFKTHLLELLNDVAQKGRSFIITKRGIPVASVAPIKKISRSLRGSWANKIEIKGDIVHVDWSRDWDKDWELNR